MLLRFLDAEGGDVHARRCRTRPRWTGTPSGGSSGCAPRTPTSSTAPCGRTCGSPVRSATEDELRQALAEARLLEWVDALPDGLDTLVGEHGARLSGGQRQRLALARALLADFPVLVLDEPAEHLDLATADALTADLLAATEGRTTVLITHRLQGLDAVDEIIVLDGGPYRAARHVRGTGRGRRAAAPDAGARTGGGPARRAARRSRGPGFRSRDDRICSGRRGPGTRRGRSPKTGETPGRSGIVGQVAVRHLAGTRNRPGAG